jgi:hypothetical protein
MYSGLVSKYAEQHVKRIDKDMLTYGGSKETIQVPCFRLDTIVTRNNLAHVDYCSIDTEGGELDILRTVDLRVHDISVISVENNYYGKALKEFMVSQKYSPMAIVGADEFYRRKRTSWWIFG